MKMKKSNLATVFLLLVLALSIASCNKKDETTNGELTGVWNCTAVNYTGNSVTEFMGESATTDFTGEGYNVDFTFTVSENPNVATSNGSYSIKLTSNVNGQTIIQNTENISFIYTGSWSKDGNKMTIIRDGESSDATIVKLTDTELELNIDDVRTIENGDIKVTSTTNMTVSFIR